MGHASTEELRDAMIADLTRKQLEARRNALLAGDKRTMTDVCNSVLDYLACAADMPELVKKAVLSAPATVGEAFAGVVQRVMHDEAECDAIRQVEQLERDAKDDPASYAPKTRAVAQFAERAA